MAVEAVGGICAVHAVRVAIGVVVDLYHDCMFEKMCCVIEMSRKFLMRLCRPDMLILDVLLLILKVG